MFTINKISEEMIKIFETLNDGIILTDKDSVVIYINSSYTNLTGVKLEDIKGRLLRDVRSGSRLHEALQAKKPMINVKRYQNGVESYVDLLPIFEDNQLIGGLALVKDAKSVRNLIDEINKTKEKQKQLNHKIKNLNKVRYTFDSIIGKDTGLKELVDYSKRIAIKDSNIIISGESGTGKEVFAQSVHNYSNRKDNPFIAVNCSAIPENLWESEFFGYNSGAFSGSKKDGKLGLFEIANKGTLFLDEVGEVPLYLQPKLLRVLEEGRFRRVGGKEEIDIDVRIIAATNKNLKQRIKEGVFRLDLYYRLAVFPIEIPPLREHKEDISIFIENYIKNYEKRFHKNIRVNKEAIKLLLEYSWPGNVRELKNTLEFSSNFLIGDEITVKSLPDSIKNIPTFDEFNDEKPLKELIENFEKKIIMKNIDKYGDSLEAKKMIAKKLNISLSSLYNKIK